jgi:tryptophan synthase beta chain
MTITGMRLDRPDAHGRFGEFGGQYAPETLMPALAELVEAFEDAWSDDAFIAEYRSMLENFVGRPTPLHVAARLSEHLGVRVLLKREDLAHTGAHKINNAIGQGLLAKRMGKPRVIAETGAGQHGVATATAAAVLGLECSVYMGAVDIERQALNVLRMRILGAEVVPVTSGAGTLKDAVSEAMRDWVRTVENTHYIIGSVVGPHPFPWIVREFQKVIGEEVLDQLGDDLPDVVVACVGGGSNAMGIFYPLADRGIDLVGIEAAGEGIATGRHGASIGAGTPGVLHGTRTYMLQDADGQVQEAHSISAGLDYPGLGPSTPTSIKPGWPATSPYPTRSPWGRGTARPHRRHHPALETAHAVAWIRTGGGIARGKTVLLNLSGRGDKDVEQIGRLRPEMTR